MADHLAKAEQPRAQPAERVIASARGWLGTPYQHQASLKGVGCDCLGLIRGVWRELIGEEPEVPPPYSADWAESALPDAPDAFAEAGRRWLSEIRVCDAAPGAVVLFRWRPGAPAKHAGILSAEEHFIHAYERAGVIESPLVPAWRYRLSHAFLIPGH